MNKRATASDALTSRVIEEITFQANILALHSAIESAAGCNGELEPSGEIAGVRRDLDDQLHVLVERALRPEGRAESLHRPNPRGL